jgi:hypothetical protein
MKRISSAVLFWLLFFSALIFAQPTTWQALAPRIPGGLDARRLTHLEQQWLVEEVEPNLLKMTHKETGMVKYVDITDHQMDFNKLPPAVQVIDLTNADTTLYNWKYVRKNMFPIGSLSGYPMTIGDFNKNGRLDLAGSYKVPQQLTLADVAIAELQPDSTFEIQKIYTDSVTKSLAFTNVDGDSLQELNLRRHQLFYNYEASDQDSFPNIFNFSHRMWEISSAVGSETFVDLDNDKNMDVLYVGDDSLPPMGQKVFIAEYDNTLNRFLKRFSHRPQPEWRVSGFSVGDFDEDGFKEFATGSVFGDVYVFENDGNDSYQQVFYDTLSASNAYLTGATNDIDRNGKIEFFLGGSSYYNGTPASRIYWFEANGNNNYQKIRSFFLLGTDVLGTTELFIHDANRDGIDELVFCFSYLVVILSWNPQTQQFDIHYLDEWESDDQEIQSVNMADVFNSGALDLFVNVVDIATVPRIRTYYYQANTITGIDPVGNPVSGFSLYQNYPNPFNKSTLLSFQLPQHSTVSLTIYDITGKEVTKLINNRDFAPGDHQVYWEGTSQNGKEVSSGIYPYELSVIDSPKGQRGRRYKEVKKMLLIR